MNRRRGEVARKRLTIFITSWLVAVLTYIYIYIWMMN